MVNHNPGLVALQLPTSPTKYKEKVALGQRSVLLLELERLRQAHKLAYFEALPKHREHEFFLKVKLVFLLRRYNGIDASFRAQRFFL